MLSRRFSFCALFSVATLIAAAGCEDETNQTEDDGEGGSGNTGNTGNQGGTGNTGNQGGTGNTGNQGGMAGMGGATGGGGSGGAGGAADPDETMYYFGDVDTDGDFIAGSVGYPGQVNSKFTLDGLNPASDIRSVAVKDDGTQIAVAGEDDGTGLFEINLYNADGSGVAVNLVTAPSVDVELESLAFSHDGVWLAYRADATTNGANELWVVPTAGGLAKRVSAALGNSDFDVTVYTWQPDLAVGVEYLAYQADETVNNEFSLYTVEVNADTVVDVVPEATATTSVAIGVPAFDSTGRVYFRGDFEVNDEFRLYRADINGTNRVQVPGTSGFQHTGNTLPSDIGAVGMSADGTTLAFSVDSPNLNLYHVYTLDLSGNTPVKVSDVNNTLMPGTLTGPDFGSGIQFSPDGSFLAVRADWPIAGDADDNDYSAWVIPTAGTGAVRLFKVGQGASLDVDGFAFTASSARLFVYGELLVDQDRILVSTDDFATADQAIAGATEESCPAGGDVDGIAPHP